MTKRIIITSIIAGVMAPFLPFALIPVAAVTANLAYDSVNHHIRDTHHHRGAQQSFNRPRLALHQ
jgi:hypothetical protein